MREDYVDSRVRALADTLLVYPEGKNRARLVENLAVHLQRAVDSWFHHVMVGLQGGSAPLPPVQVPEEEKE